MKRVQRLKRLVSLRCVLHRQAEATLLEARGEMNRVREAIGVSEGLVHGADDRDKCSVAQWSDTIKQTNLHYLPVALEKVTKRAAFEREKMKERKQMERLLERIEKREMVDTQRREVKRIDDWVSSKWSRKCE
jgi:hypothetical protein